MSAKQSGRITSDYRVGPGMTSLLLIFVALCMAALAVLSFASVRVDTSLNDRAAEATVRYYQAAARAQEQLFQLDQQLLADREAAAPVVNETAADQATADNGPDKSVPAEAEPEQRSLTVPLGDGRELVLALEVKAAPAVERYVLRSHRVMNVAEWEAEQNIGVYVPPEAD